MATTPNRGYQLPAASSKLKDDVLRLIAALGAIDTDVAGLLTALGGKSDLGHGHAMAEITGLVAALGNKLDVGYHDALANLTDVDVAGVANGMALLRQASKWIPVALQINNIAGLETALNGKATPADITAAINALVAAAPGALDTLNELATALGNDPNFATTITSALAGKQPLDSDLTAIAALTTTAFGRALLTAADAAALRTAADAAPAGSALRDDVDQNAQSKASGLKVNILKNTLQAWERIGDEIVVSSPQAAVTWTDLSPYRHLRLRWWARPTVDNEVPILRTSADNGASFTTTTYAYQFYNVSGSIFTGERSVTSGFMLAGPTGNEGDERAWGCTEILEFNLAGSAIVSITDALFYDGSTSLQRRGTGGRRFFATQQNALQFRFLSGNISIGSFVLEGIRG